MCRSRHIADSIIAYLLWLVISSLTTDYAFAGEGIEGIAALRTCTSHRVSSFDPRGGNTDYWWISPGMTRPMLDAKGAGCIKHIWITTPSKKCSATWYEGSLQTTVIRMYWDGEEKPSVDVPLGIFFCAPFDTARQFKSDAIVLGPLDGRGFNMYFPMPFEKSARIELVNYNTTKKFRIYFHIDYVLYPDGKLPTDQGRFHARYNKQQLVKGQNYVFLDTKGRGHYVGTVLALDTNCRGDRSLYQEKYKDRPNAWWEGDEMIYIDGELAYRGTGTEDYFGTSWSYADGQAFCAPQFGAAMCGYDPRDYGRWCLYRWHITDPVIFNKSIKVTIEHGRANEFDIAPYESVAYWYQVEPHIPWQPCVTDEKDISKPLPPVK